MNSEDFIQKANKRSVQISKIGDYFIVLFFGCNLVTVIASVIYSYLKFGYANPDILYCAFRLM